MNLEHAIPDLIAIDARELACLDAVLDAAWEIYFSDDAWRDADSAEQRADYERAARMLIDALNAHNLNPHSRKRNGADRTEDD
jgi:hypothetical protein